MFNIQEELKKLPDKPGVYIMHDADDRVLYVGKAVVLKNRVRQYFQTGYKRSPKIEKMVSLISWFEYIVTDSETEALVLECNLIKEHRPPYNTLLTDDKAYPFIRISMSEKFPRIFLARNVKRDGSKYFGPYTSVTAVREVIELVKKIYFLRSCNRRLPADIGKERPCLNYHIGLCKAPCQGNICEEEYKANVANALEFLGGKYSSVRRELLEKMKVASESMDYETAASLRDLIAAIDSLEECQKITKAGDDDRDVIAIAREGASEIGASKSGEQPAKEVAASKSGEQPAKEVAASKSSEQIAKTHEDAVAQVFFVRGGKLIGRDQIHIRVAIGDDDKTVMAEVIKQFYAGTPYMPKEILCEVEPEDRALLEKWLSQKTDNKVKIVIPQKGNKHKLLNLASENARLLLSQRKEQLKREEARTVGAVREIAKLLELPDTTRMEAYDISNISGFLSVGSMVVFEGGKPRRNDYRKFRIKTVDGPNDYASLYEVITRRISHGLLEINGDEKETSFSRLPDLIMMDGGKGQVKMAEEALAALGVSIPVCGMVKDDNHRTRALYYNGAEIPIEKRSETFALITNIQDEAHRFAIEYHRSLRGKNQVRSILDDIDGIGPKRRAALMEKFGTIDKIAAASTAELASVPGITTTAAQMVYAFFHDGEIE